MSNPYDPNASGSDPAPYGGGSNPYGQPGSPTPYGGATPPPSNPYGPPAPPSSPYGGGPGGPGGPDAAKTDVLSIVGFVLSLTCCLSVVGAILGFIGLGRTKNGQRKGRWAAIAASIIGVIGTIALIVIIVVVVFFAKKVVTPSNASVGECVNVSQSSSDNTYSLLKKSCTDSHDAEIVFVGKVSADPSFNDQTAAAKDECLGQMDPTDAAKVKDGDYDWSILVVDPANPDPNSNFICYVENSDGSKLTGSLLGKG